MNKIKVILATLTVIFITGCGAPAYQTITTDIPLINHKNDIRVDLGVSAPSVNATVSYGLTDLIAIQGYGSMISEDAYYFQPALGLYKNMGNRKVQELYCGYGYGYGVGHDSSRGGEIFGKYQVYFLQYNYGTINGKNSNTELGFSLKAGYLHSELTNDGYYETDPIESSEKYQDDCILIEPIGMIRFGMVNRKFSIKLGGTYMYKFTNTDKEFPYWGLNLGLALNFRPFKEPTQRQIKR